MAFGGDRADPIAGSFGRSNYKLPEEVKKHIPEPSPN